MRPETQDELLSRVEQVMAGEDKGAEFVRVPTSFADAVPGPQPPHPEPPSTVVPIRSGQQQNNQKLTTLQRIAKECCLLPWREAEAMAKAIEEKQKAGGASTLVAAIQNWAWEWETFKEEERPRPAET